MVIVLGVASVDIAKINVELLLIINMYFRLALHVCVVTVYFTLLSLQTQSVIEVYNLDNGKKHCEKQLESERCVPIVRQIFALDEATVVCSIGKDIHIIPCDLKLKID